MDTVNLDQLPHSVLKLLRDQSLAELAHMNQFDELSPQFHQEFEKADRIMCAIEKRLGATNAQRSLTLP